ncbi:MAG: arginine--tRNA ligase [Myxococcales bacterium]|nr:arginine--tRNA ligase [Myxococcales bacterium]
MRIEPYLDGIAAQAIRDALDVDAPAILRPTQDASHGDYQINGVLGLAKRLKQNPRELAQKVAERLVAHEAIASAEVAGPGFVNLRLDDGWLSGVLGAALADRARDGVPAVESPETVVVDFSSPNIAKQMHVGHLRSTIIGDSLVRIYRFAGHTVIGDNHLGDWGTQFGLLIVGMREWGSEEALAADPIVELERVYKLASAQAKDDEAFAESARAELAKLQAGDAENHALWQKFIDVSKTSLNAVYDRLGVRFDEWLGESAYNDRLPGVVELLLEKGIAREDEGAICVFFNELAAVDGKLKKQKVPFIVRKRDGAFLYSTSDIATVLYRKERWDADRAVYVVDKRQAGHFDQLFEVMRLLGVEMKLEHVGFGMVLGDDGKPKKTRDASGKVETLASLLDEAEQRAETKMLEELSLDPAMAHELRGSVGVGAVKYADLMQNRTSDYTFDWDKLIAFKGNAGPYVQYQHARCCSVLRKSEQDRDALAGPMVLEHDVEKALARELAKLPDVIASAADSSNPHYIAAHLYELASLVAAFWEHCPVLDAEAPIRESRLGLADLSRRQLARGLNLLGIDAPERM